MNLSLHFALCLDSLRDAKGSITNERVMPSLDDQPGTTVAFERGELTVARGHSCTEAFRLSSCVAVNT